MSWFRGKALPTAPDYRPTERTWSNFLAGLNDVHLEAATLQMRIVELHLRVERLAERVRKLEDGKQ